MNGVQELSGRRSVRTSGEPMFNILEADKQGRTVTVVIREDLLPLVSWACKHCPPLGHLDEVSPRYQEVIGILGSQLYKLSLWFRNKVGIQDLRALNGREIVEYIIYEDGHEIEFRKPVEDEVEDEN